MNTRLLLQRLVSPLVLTLGGMAAAQAPTSAQRVLLAQAELIAAITTPDQADLVRTWLDAALVLVLGREPEAATRLAPAAQTLVTEAAKSLATARPGLQASVWRDVAGLLEIGSKDDDAKVLSWRRCSLNASATAPQQHLALRLLRDVRADGKPASPEPLPRAEGLDTWRQQQDDLLAKVLESHETSVTLRQAAFDHLAEVFQRQAEVDGDAPKQRVERLERFAKAAQQLLPELDQASLAEEPGRATTQWPFTTLRLVQAVATGGANQVQSVDPFQAGPTAEIRRWLGDRWVPLTTWPGPAATRPTAPDTRPASISLRMIAEREAIYWLRVTTHHGMVNVLLTWSSATGARRLGSGAIEIHLPAPAPSRQVLVAELRADGSCLLTRAACVPYSILELRRRCRSDDQPNQTLVDSFGTVTEQTRDIGSDTSKLLVEWLTSTRSDSVKLHLPTATVATVLTACAGAEPFDLHLDANQRLLDRESVADANKRYILIDAIEVPQ